MNQLLCKNCSANLTFFHSKCHQCGMNVDTANEYVKKKYLISIVEELQSRINKLSYRLNYLESTPNEKT